MPCDTWKAQLDAYADGELPQAEASAFSAHIRGCPACATEALERVQMKRSVAAAGRRYIPSSQLRAEIARSVAQRRLKPRWQWRILLLPALAVLIISIFVNWYAGRENARRQQIYSELADLHVTTLASATPVDVLSTDRHTVKPWFQGRIPFSFNLPELQGTEFTLLGGRVTYISQRPGAHLIYRIRKHEISVFIFQDRDSERIPSGSTHTLSFNAESWTEEGARYFVIGDASREDIESLSKLLRDAI